MTWPFSAPVTADTTKVTADNTTVRPLARIAERIGSLIPGGWTKRGSAPIRDAVYAGAASAFAWIDSFTAYAKKQTRLATMTGFWLDLAAFDFFGLRIQRRKLEADGTFSKRIRAEIIRPRSTRAAIARAVTDLTGLAPDILEPFNPGDCGGYGIGTLAYGGAVSVIPTLSGYDAPLGGYGAGAVCYGTPNGGGQTGGGSGAYGSVSIPNQFFITVHRPAGIFPELGACGGYGVGPLAYGGGLDGVPALPGYGNPLGGYGVGAESYGIPAPPYAYFPGAGYYPSAPDLVSISDAEIYATIADTVAAGTVAWTRIQGP